jgi:hypothetical protein
VSDSSFSGRPVPDGVVAIPQSVTADWGSASGSISAGAGAPVGDLGVTFYFDVTASPYPALYQWDGASWIGPLVFTYSSEPANPDWPVDSPATHWVQGDETFTITGGIWGPRVLTYFPADADVIAWDAGTSEWTTSSTVARTDESNTFTVSGQVIEGDDAAEVPLTVRGASGQSVNLLEVKENGGTARFTVSDAGYTTTANIQSAGGVRVGTAVSYTTNQKWVSVDNAASVPSAVTSGAIVYAEAGELRARSALANVGLTAKRVAVKTGAHTFEGADQGAIVVLNSSSNFDFTIPEDASVNFPVGTTIMVAVQSTGHATVVGSGAATVTGTTVLNTTGTIATLIKVAANTWLMHH